MPQSRQKTHTSEKRIRAPSAEGSAPCAPCATCCDMRLSPHVAAVSSSLSMGCDEVAPCATCSGHFYIGSFFFALCSPSPFFFCTLENNRDMSHMSQPPASRCKSASCVATCQSTNMLHVAHISQGVPFMLDVRPKPRTLRASPLRRWLSAF